MFVLLPANYLLLAVLLHSSVARVRPAGNRVRQFLAVGTAAGLAMLWHAGHKPELGLAAQTALTLAYAFGCELYIFLFTFVTSSVSVALLVSKFDGVGASTLVPDEMVAHRLSDMTTAGLLTTEAGQFYITPKSRTILKIHQCLRRFFRHDVTMGVRP